MPLQVSSSGATLYEAASDRLAFEPTGRNGEVSYPQLEGSPPSLRSVAPRVPAALDHAVMALLAPEPSHRPESALAAMARLSAALPKRQQGLWPKWVSAARPVAAG